MSSGNSSRGISLVAHRSEAPMFDKKTTLSNFAAIVGLTMRKLPQECREELEVRSSVPPHSHRLIYDKLHRSGWFIWHSVARSEHVL
jgi:hypothetical protein